jgi:vanillate O-demethylase monooxygenase subunit
MAFLQNTWTMIGWADELDAGFVHRTVADQPVLVYRRQDGTPAALHDRCPHRIVPLHRGHQRGDAIECGYHGLRFGADGRCVQHPVEGQPIPAAAKVRAYPVAERHGILWVWLGDPARADVSRIADFAFLTDPRRSNVAGYAHMKANYLLSIDNLCDLTHVQFVHGEFQGSEAFSRLQVNVRQDGDTVFTTLTLPGGRPPPFFASAMADPEQPIDLVMTARWNAPGLIELTFLAYPPGRRDTPHFESRSAHIVTPESATTSHYFYVNSRSHALGDPGVDAHVREWQRIGFGEQDKPMLEAQQQCLGERDVLDFQPVLLGSDAGAMRVRRVLTALLEAEARPG